MELIGKMIEIYFDTSFTVFIVPFNLKVLLSPEIYQTIKIDDNCKRSTPRATSFIEAVSTAISLEFDLRFASGRHEATQSQNTQLDKVGNNPC